MPVDKEWKERVLKFRADAHMTQQALARAMQVSESTVRRWERGTEPRSVHVQFLYGMERGLAMTTAVEHGS